MSKKETGKYTIKLILWLVAVMLLCIAGSFMKPYVTEKQSDAGIVINELMTENTSCAPHNGLFSAWVELKNISGETVSLGGMRMISDTKPKKMFTLPEIELAPGETAVIWCQGSRGVRDELSAAFTLSPTGGTLMLLDSSFNLTDETVYPALSANEVYARGEDGEFTVTGEFTPGAENTAENHLALLNAEPEAGELVIAEVCADPSDGSDYVCLRNLASQKISLNGWYLTDNRLNLTKMRLPDISLEPGAETRIDLNAVFSLNSDGESVFLTDPAGTIRSAVSWETLGKDVTLLWTGSGYVTSAPDYNMIPEGDLYISEVAIRLVGLHDFIEVANRAASDIDLSGYGLSDDVEHPRKYTFPSGTVIPANGVACVQLKDEKLFRLKADGSETAVLATPDGTVLDTLSTAGMRSNTSVGRDPDTLERVFYRNPSPGERNGGGATEILAAVTFSHDGGQIEEEMLSVSLFASEGASVFYTLDGTEPTKNSEQYTEPLILTNDTVIRAIAWKEGSIESEPVSRTYTFERQNTMPADAEP